MDYTTIGRRIKDYRKRAGLRQADLAEKLDVSISYLSQIECGKSEVSLKRLDEIAVLVQTKLQNLVADINDEQNSYLQWELNEKTQGWSREKRLLLLNIVDAINKSL